MYGELTLREALAVGLLERFVRQEESRGSELTHGSQLERALALLVTQADWLTSGLRSWSLVLPWVALRTPHRFGKLLLALCTGG